MRKIFLTMTWNMECQCGEPVMAYPTKEQAEAAVASSCAARDELDRLWKQDVLSHKPGCTMVSCCGQTKEFCFGSKDGSWYRSQAAADYADLQYDFWRRDDIVALKKQHTEEDFVQPLRFNE